MEKERVPAAMMGKVRIVSFFPIRVATDSVSPIISQHLIYHTLSHTYFFDFAFIPKLSNPKARALRPPTMAKAKARVLPRKVAKAKGSSSDDGQ
mmetsp:Transcript_28754/g.69674  ORF Transcript_28754/g.69674 Transcript_28754/m.69674 type:complete len:94 (-) Transcript_28754:22-303(-)